MIEHLISAKALAFTGAAILLVSLAGCTTGVPGASPAASTSASRSSTEPPKDVSCVEGLSLRPGDSCSHEGGRFWVEDGQACYSGRYLHFGSLIKQSDRQCLPASIRGRQALGELCFDGQQGRREQSKGCSSDQFGFGVEVVTGTSNWRVSQVRQVRNIEWDGRAIHVEGTCEVTPGTSAKGACLRVQIKSPSGGACIINGGSCNSDYGLDVKCNGPLDATLLRNGDLHVGRHGVFSCAGPGGCGGQSSGSPVVCEP